MSFRFCTRDEDDDFYMNVRPVDVAKSLGVLSSSSPLLSAQHGVSLSHDGVFRFDRSLRGRFRRETSFFTRSTRANRPCLSSEFLVRETLRAGEFG